MPADTTVYAAWIGASATLLGSAAGAYFGAMLAFRFNREEKEREQVQLRVAAANRALFILGQQLNLMANIKKQHLDAARNSPDRFIKMLPFPPVRRPEWRLRLDTLDFMLPTSFRDSLMAMLLADDWFQQLLDILALRYELHNERAQPKLEASTVPAGQDVTLEAITAVLGPKLTADLKQATDSLYGFVDEGCKKHAKLGERLAQEFKHLFPEHSFIWMSVDRNYFHLS